MCLWSSHMELEIKSTEVVSSNSIKVEVPTEIEVAEGKKDYEVSVVKKEYTIIGDSIFIPSMYEDAPPWLKDFIDTTIDVAVNNRDQSLIDRLESILSALDYVPKNQYTEQINQIISEDGIINSRIATLNSNFTDAINTANATIAEINLTYASKDEAAAIATNALTASLSADGEIGSALIQLQEAYADLESTTAQSISMLESVMEGEINGNAAAMETIRTYVGISESGGSTGTGLLADVSILQKQNDGIIETVTGTYDVMLGVEYPNNNTGNDELDVTKEPYKSWRAADAIVGGVENRAMHVGDVYIKYSAAEHGYKTYERAYKFIRTSVDNTSPYSTDSEGFTWALIVDTDAQNAYVAALNALDLADNKRRVFTETPSGPYDKGDLWTKATERGSVLYRANADRASGFLATEWTEADDAALKDFEATVYDPKISMLETQIDSQINYFYNHVATTTTQVTTQLNTWKSTWTTPELKAAHHGDIGIFTKRGTEGEAYAYSRGTNSWILITDNGILKALMSAATAQATADGVVVSFYAIKQDTAPATTSLWLNKTGTKVLKKYTTSWVNVAVKLGDTLTAYDPITKDTSVYVYNGTGWITNTENGIVAGSEAITTLTTNLANTNTTVGGHTTQLNTVDARIANGVASVESKWAYNSAVNINGVYKKSGFGLTTNYTSGNGTESNPYVSEFWIDASRLRFTNSNQTGRTSPFTIDATGTTPQITFNGIVNFSNVSNVPVINKTYVQTSQPTSGMNKGDTWIDTDDNNNLYTYNGSSWVKTQSGTKTYLQTTAPTSGMTTGDIWVDSDDNYKQYRYNGSSWVVLAYNPATAVNAGTTTINGGKITTGSITAAQIKSNSVSADRLLAGTNSTTVWTGGGLVSSNFNGNPYGNIGSPTQGFRLSSGAAGTSSDPNIYGAYIKGATLEGVYVNIGDIKVKSTLDPSKTGRISHSIKSGSFVGRNYGSGHYKNRVCSTTSQLVVYAHVRARNASSTGTFKGSVYLQYSTNGGGSWANIDSDSIKFETPGYGFKITGNISLFGVLAGSVVPDNGTISFRVTGSGENISFSNIRYVATVYNQ